jgi:hypothetical protein
MIHELEERARALGNGDARYSVTADIGWLLPSAFDGMQPHIH